ncbi:MAG TPA: transporter [Gemmataceae bacterium]|nr:transporter [Gemmataceae bacterium]
MRRSILFPVFLAAVALAGGCAAIPEPVAVRSQMPEAAVDNPRDGEWKKRDSAKENGEKNKPDEKDKSEKKEKSSPKTLFEWAIGPEVEEKEDKGPDTIVTDRPDFTEASSTVGLGRVQLEAGYTYFRDRSGGSTFVTQTYPEALLRIGVLADWFEVRLGQTYIHSRTTAFGRTTEHLSGLSDLYVGAKLALTEQKGELPEMAIVFQALVPTAGELLTADRVLPGFNYLYGWDIIPDFLSAGGSFGANKVVDDDGHSFVVVSQSFTIGYTLTEQFGAYTEWFALYPSGATARDTSPEHYFNGGFTYKVTPDFQLDIRAGVGLNKHAQDFFTGVGFAVRY